VISHKLKYLFLHPNKCGGKSIENAIWSIPPKPGSSDHRVLSEYIDKHGDVVLGYYKFMFCRNPWDRLVSIYYGRKQLLKVNMPTFDRFIIEADPNKAPTKSQTSWLKVEGEIIKPNFLGRFETYKKDWSTLSSFLDINLKLPHLNKSDHKPYYELYNKKLINIVFEKYKEDIEYFEYSFRSDM